MAKVARREHEHEREGTIVPEQSLAGVEEPEEEAGEEAAEGMKAFLQKRRKSFAGY